MKIDVSKICFGLSEELDRQSLSSFLQLCGQKPFADLLAGRLSSEETEQLVDSFMDLIRRHLSESEYHSVFLGDTENHQDPQEELQ